ncbi:unnamed protein product [Blepharisma stoltei]|uniref:Uncharacterized protein n=1 Tax=Blepharisma stoltei TaxID=1481888 RepID=A0AAU9J1J5_9CILI|nr:unnamed protein product [Blepharisma stoltei]
MSEAKQDYRISYADLRANLNRDDLDLQLSLIEVESQISEFDQNLMSSDQSHTFINSHLPQVVRALLDKKCSHLSLSTTFQVNELLKKILILFIKN